jgi:exonuclease III
MCQKQHLRLQSLRIWIWKEEKDPEKSNRYELNIFDKLLKTYILKKIHFYGLCGPYNPLTVHEPFDLHKFVGWKRYFLILILSVNVFLSEKTFNFIFILLPRLQQTSYFFVCHFSFQILSDRYLLALLLYDLCFLSRTVISNEMPQHHRNIYQIKILICILYSISYSMNFMSFIKIRGRNCEFTDVHDSHYLLLLCGDVEMNPGPMESNGKQIGLKLMTQNCRGLQDQNKLRHLLKNKNAELKESKMILALQETHLMNDFLIKWSGNYVISNSASPHSAGCVTYFNDYVNIVEVKHIDGEGHGHVVAVEGLESKLIIVANIYSPVRSLPREQVAFYNNLISIIDEMEQRYIAREPGLIILGDFNLPLEQNMAAHNNSTAEVARARMIGESMWSRGLTDCWKPNDERYTFKTGETRLDRILYRLDTVYQEKLETIWTFTSSDHCLLKLTLFTEK